MSLKKTIFLEVDRKPAEAAATAAAAAAATAAGDVIGESGD
jgi:hypothetical protein